MAAGNARSHNLHHIGRFSVSGRCAYGLVRPDCVELVADEDGSEWGVLTKLRDGIHPDWHGERIALEDAKLQAPLGRAQRVFAVALNYHTHVGETRNEPPESPIIFYKPPSAFIQPNAMLRPPAQYTAQFDYEGEIGIVIGKECRQVLPKDALSCVFGITAVMDGTARDRLRVKAGEKVFLDWLSAKAFDDSSLLGPVIAIGKDVQTALRDRTIGVQTFLNGELVQEGSIADLIFSTEEIIAFLTRFITLMPGDILSIGTPGGIGLARGRLLRKEDHLSVQVSHLPLLEATVG